MSDWLKVNAISLLIALTTLVSTYAVYGYRLSAVEARQDRQGTSITNLQSQVGDLSASLAAIKATIDAINDNVNYIRSRIDKTQ